MNATQTAYRFAVLNCAVTQILGRYATFEEAEVEAKRFGNCSFPYELSDTELAAVVEAAPEPTDAVTLA